ncbi:MAG: ribonuclease HI family protein [Phycisphaeraceae bacterium]|nr:ribonuclease HI family protein [Phycisphaeraceae bacterium]
MHLIIHVDGGARGNPGPAGAGVVIREAASGRFLHEAGYFMAHATNNEAEYHGLIRALQVAAQLGGRHLTIHSDSQLMVRQLLGEYRVKSATLRPLYDQVRKLLAAFQDYKLTHVLRHHNDLADRLANQAMDARSDVDYTQRGR